MTRKTWIQLAVVALIVQAPIWLQERSRRTFIETIRSGGKTILAARVPAAVTSSSVEGEALAWSLLNDRKGDGAQKLKALEGKIVIAEGFMVPLEDKQNETTEFLLVPAPMSCIHVAPPPPEQIIYVVMDDGKSSPVSLQAVRVTGTFFAAGAAAGTTKTQYSMTAQSVTVLPK